MLGNVAGFLTSLDIFSSIYLSADNTLDKELKWAWLSERVAAAQPMHFFKKMSLLADCTKTCMKNIRSIL